MGLMKAPNPQTGNWEGVDALALNDDNGERVTVARIKATESQLAETVNNTESILGGGAFSSLQTAINQAILEGKQLRLPKGRHIITSGLTIDGSLNWENTFKEVILDFSTMTAGVAITIGTTKGINGVSLSGLWIIGNTNIDCFLFNSTADISKPITDGVFKSMRIEGFKVGLKGSYSWGLLFENIRFQNCSKDLELNSQFNHTEFLRCSLVTTPKFATFNNCEGIHFNTCEFANLEGNDYGISVYQSWITITNPYCEYVPKLMQLGSPSESTPSICEIKGGLVDGRINIAKNKALLNISGSRANYNGFALNAGLDDVGAVFMRKSNIHVISNHTTKWLESWDGNTTVPFAEAFGGGLTKTQLRDSMQLSHSFTNQGIKISSTLTIGKQYMLVLAIQKSSGLNVSLTSGIANPVANYIKDYDGLFEVVYMPFVATTTSLFLVWGAGSIYARYIGLLEGVDFPEVNIKGNTPIFSGSVPSLGTWETNDRVVRKPQIVGQPKAWVCTVGGTPGTWVSEGNL